MPTIHAVDETWDESAGWTHTGEPGGGSATAERMFHVYHDTDTRPTHILADHRIPKNGSSHPWNPHWRCRGTTVSRKSPVYSDAKSTYEVKAFTGGDDNEDNPLNQPPQIRYSTTYEELPISHDIHGRAIVTANYERFGGITKPFNDLSWTITRNLPFFNPVSIYVYPNTVNSATYFGFPPGVVKCIALEAENVVDDEFSYFTVTGEFQARKPIQTPAARAWWLRLRHEGFYIKHPNITFNGLPIPYHARELGEPVSQPVLIDAVTGFRVSEPQWVEFEIFESTDHNAIGLI